MVKLAKADDFNFIYGLYMLPHVNPYLLYEMMPKEAFLPIFDTMIQQNIKFIYGDGIDDIGMFKLIPMLHRNHHIVYLGGLAILPAFSGKGEGIKMMKEIIASAVEKGFLRIELSVSSTNEKAIHLYEKAGFQREGLLRKFTHLKSENRFIDEVLMSCLL